MGHDEAVQRWPLQWPLGWIRTERHRRTRATFSTKSSADNRLSVAKATVRLEAEIDRLGGKNATLSTNVPLRLDGGPRSDTEPTDPGVALYFGFKGRATVFACDKFDRVADNVAAIAAHIDALRRIARYGVGSLEQALAGYKALPADTAADWRKVLGVPASALPAWENVRAMYKALAREVHPDLPGGSVDAFTHLGRALEFAEREYRERGRL